MPLGDKDLGALLHRKTAVLLDAGIEAGAQRAAVRLDVLGHGLGGIDEKEHNMLAICLASQHVRGVLAGEEI